MATTNGSTTRDAPLPLFYTKPIVINQNEHATAGIREAANIAFARRATLLPLALEEVFPAAVAYPLVVIAKPQPTIAAVVGFDDGVNLFVDAEGRWRPEAHIPAYVRRWPYISALLDGGDRIVLCADNSMIDPEPTEARRFFVDGAPSPLLVQATEFCRAYQFGTDRAGEFARTLVELNLVVERVFETRFAADSGRKPSVLRGCSVVDEERFNALSDEVWLSWRAKGWIAVVHALLMSQLRWPALNALADLGLKRR